MEVILVPALQVLIAVVEIYVYVVAIGVVLSWLTAFNVVNMHNRFVYLVVDITNRMTEPALRPIRGLIPNMGGLDISPMVLILGLWFVEGVLRQLLFKFA